MSWMRLSQGQECVAWRRVEHRHLLSHYPNLTGRGREYVGDWKLVVGIGVSCALREECHHHRLHRRLKWGFRPPFGMQEYLPRKQSQQRVEKPDFCF